MPVTCPKCKSDQISAQKKGFSGGKALAGAVIAGPVGALAGTHGSGKVIVTCLNCGHNWNPISRKKQEVFENQVSELTWKNQIYSLYKQGKKEEAENLFLSKSEYSPKLPDFQAVVKDAENEQNSQYILGVFMVIGIILAVIFLVWLIN